MSIALNYRKRVRHDVDSWVARGWVRPEHAADLVESIPDRSLRDSLPSIIAMLGAVLLAFAAMTFVASNWHGIPKVLRLAGLFAVMWCTWLGAIAAYRTAHRYLFEAAVVLGCGMFGVNIMLIAQMYHIDSHYPDGVLLWAMGSLLVAGLTRSVGAVIAGFGLLCLWTAMISVEFRNGVHWEFLIAWSAAAWLVWHDRWNEGLSITLIAGLVWANLSLISAGDAHDWPFPVVLSLLTVFSLAMLLLIRVVKTTSLAAFVGTQTATMAIGFVAVILGIFTLQFFTGDLAETSFFAAAEGGPAYFHWAGPFAVACAAAVALAATLHWRGGADVRDVIAAGGAAAIVFLIVAFAWNEALAVAVMAAGFFGLSVWLIDTGQRTDRTALINFGFVAFGAEALYVYFRTLGTLLDTALFFLLGGVILFALALVLERTRRLMLHRRRTEQDP